MNNFKTGALRPSLYLSLFLSLFVSAALAQTNCVKDCSCSISGGIIDATTNEPVSYATVQLNGSAKGTLTDLNGKFILSGLCLTEFDITISHLGYKTVIHHHDIYHPDLVVKLAPDNVILESVVVEGESIATGFESITESKLTGKDLESLKNGSFGEVLTNLTGVAALKTGSNVVKPIIHGLHSDRILIINNGVRHASQRWGTDHAAEIDAAMIDNITLVKGAAAVKYGPGAMGGVIIVNAPKMELSTGHLHGDAGITAASNGRSLSGDILLQRGYKRFAWMGQAAGLYQGDLSAPDYQLTNTGARELSYTLGSRYHQEKLDLTFYYSHVKQQLGILRGSVVGNLDDLENALLSSRPFYTRDFSYDLNNPKQLVTHDLMRLTGIYNWDSSQLDVQYSFQVNRRQEFDVRRGTNNDVPAIDLELLTHSLDIDWKHAPVSGWSGSIGAQWLYQNNNNLPGTNTIPFVPNYNNNRFGVYIAESKPLGKVNFEVGFRFDYQNRSVRGRDHENDIYRDKLTYQSITGISGINFDIGQNATLQSNIGMAWRPPNIAELYSYGKHEFTFAYGLWRHKTDEFGRPVSAGEVLGQNAKAVYNELGIKWVNTYNYTLDGQSLTLTGYINYISNYIYSKPAGITATVRGAFPFYIYDQTNALFLGLDAGYILKHNDQWQSQLKGSYIQATDVLNNDVLTGIPTSRAGYELSYRTQVFNLDDFEASIAGTYTFRQHRHPRVITIHEIQEAKRNNENIFQQDQSNFDFVTPPKGYLVINANIQATLDQFILGFQIKNALDQTYRSYTNLLRYFADEPGINFLLSVRYKF